jgi:hypothetical protein
MSYDPHDDETRITDATTGGMKGKKLTQLGALDPLALIELSRVAGMGANKYAPFNFMKGYDWSLSFNAMMRHALLFWNGEETDPESGLNHMAHAAWMALCLVSFSARHLGTDDRYAGLHQTPDAPPVRGGGDWFVCDNDPGLYDTNLPHGRDSSGRCPRCLVSEGVMHHDD